MNPLISKLTGQKSRVQEDVPVPVAVMPRRFYRDRMQQARPAQAELDPERADESLRAILGEAESNDGGYVIPDDAEEIDDVGHGTITAKLRDVKDVVQEPSHPSGEKEKFLTPYAALTAPDATPDAMTAIDPSKVPGSSSDQRKFTWSELAKAEPETPVESPEPVTGGDSAVNVMDLLMGRKRGEKAPQGPSEVTPTGIATEEAALAAMGIENPVIAEAAASKAAAALMPNPDPTGASAMPEHKQADVRKVCDIARKWM